MIKKIFKLTSIFLGLVLASPVSSDYSTAIGYMPKYSDNFSNFDYVYPNPIGWKKYYENVSDLYKNKKIKLLRQIIVFTIKMYIYFTIIYFIFFRKINNDLKNGLLVSSIPYIYLLSVGTLAAGTEQERILYTGFVVNILFFIILLKQNRN